MSITVSILTLAKGALFLAKSSGFKIFVAKSLPTMIGKLGLAGTIKVGVTAAAITGVGVTIYKFPEKIRDGFNLIINGMAEGKSSDFFYGILQLSSSYNTAHDLISDLNEYVELIDLSNDIKVSMHKTISDCEGLIKSEIEHNAYEVFHEIEELLNAKGETEISYKGKVQDIYCRYLKQEPFNLDILLGQCGCIYSEISQLNEELGIKPINTYDHYLVFCISGYILNNCKYQCVGNLNQEELANAITNQILDYLHATNQG